LLCGPAGKDDSLPAEGRPEQLPGRCRHGRVLDDDVQADPSVLRPLRVEDSDGAALRPLHGLSRKLQDVRHGNQRLRLGQPADGSLTDRPPTAHFLGWTGATRPRLSSAGLTAAPGPSIAGPAAGARAGAADRSNRWPRSSVALSMRTATNSCQRNFGSSATS